MGTRVTLSTSDQELIIALYHQWVEHRNGELPIEEEFRSYLHRRFSRGRRGVRIRGGILNQMMYLRHFSVKDGRVLLRSNE